jgi:hypothetical protein
MVDDVSADPRMEFFEPEASPARTPTPRPRSASDPGPSIYHQLHGSIPLPCNQELRVTTQRSLGPDRPARLVVRRWFKKPDGNWWPVPGDSGTVLTGHDAQAFAIAVAAAFQSLAGEANQ